MRPDSGIGNAECRDHFGNAAHFSTRNSVGVNLKTLPMTSERDDIEGTTAT